MIALPALAQKAEYDRARELLTTGHPDEAAAIYRELSKADPRNADLLLNLSIAEYKAGKFAYAAASAASALKLNPDLVPARLFLGASYLETGDFTHAIDALERVVAAAPGDKNARLMLGQALLGAGRAEEALEHLRLASELLPSDEPRVNTRGPSSVMATVCSKCADNDPSTVTIVHLSLSVFVAGPPTFTIGSIASVRPDTSFSRRFGLP